MQRAPPEGGAAGERLGLGVDPVFDGRRPQGAELGGEIVRQPLDHDGVAAERKMGPVLLGGAHRYDEGRPLQQPLPDRDRGHVLDAPGTGGLTHHPRGWVVVALASVLAAAEWLRSPSLTWVVVAALAAAGALAAAWPPRG